MKNSSHSDAMKITPMLAATWPLALFCLAGCQTRSISNSEFPSRFGSAATSNYHGELSELDVIGLTADVAVTETEIHAALQTKTRVALTPASKVLLIQSGAELPDAAMIEAMRSRFTIGTLSGRPARAIPCPGHDFPSHTAPSVAAKAPDAPSFAKTLRLVAARGGYDKIVCYWGVLESAREDKITSAVSWVPIIGYVIPDEREHMRIRLKAALVDVESGRWTFITPGAISSSQLSTVLSRRETDQRLVEQLKAQGYEHLARLLAEPHPEGQSAGGLSPLASQVSSR